jgi:hypothetical protein
MCNGIIGGILLGRQREYDFRYFHLIFPFMFITIIILSFEVTVSLLLFFVFISLRPLISL